MVSWNDNRPNALCLNDWKLDILPTGNLQSIMLQSGGQAAAFVILSIFFSFATEQYKRSVYYWRLPISDLIICGRIELGLGKV